MPRATVSAMPGAFPRPCPRRAARLATLATATVLLAVVLSACADDDGDGDDVDTTAPTTTAADATASPSPGGTDQSNGDAGAPGEPGIGDLSGAACPSVEEVAAAADPAVAHGDDYRVGAGQDLVCEYLVGPTDEAPAVSFVIELDSPEAIGPPAGAEEIDGPGDWTAVLEDGSVLAASGEDVVRVRLAPSPEAAANVIELVLSS